MSSRSVTAAWRGGYKCEVEAGAFTLVVDEPESVGGTDSGPQPTEVFLASIASCFALAVAHSARKRSVELGHLSVEAVGRYDGLRFDAIELNVDAGCDAGELAKLTKAAERVCYVSNTLRAQPSITVRLTSNRHG